MKKRIIGVLLIAAMLLGLMPMTAFAGVVPRLVRVLGKTDTTPGPQSGADPSEPIVWEISAANSEATLDYNDLAMNFTGGAIQIFRDPNFRDGLVPSNADPLLLTQGDITKAYIKVMYGPYVRYYEVNIFRAAAAATPTIESIVAYDTGNNEGLGNGDSIVITFDQKTNKPSITNIDINSKLKLNNGHSWGSGFSFFSSRDWNYDGNQLTIGLSELSNTTVAIGDTITIDETANIMDKNATTEACTASAVIEGSFSARTITEDTGSFEIPFKVTKEVNEYDIGEVQVGNGISPITGDTTTGTIAIPDMIRNSGRSYNVVKIGREAFANCTGLSEIIIPNSVTEIGDYAFYYCAGLSSISIPNKVTSIGENAFQDCEGLTGDFDIPASVAEIHSGAFSGCRFSSVTILRASAPDLCIDPASGPYVPAFSGNYPIYVPRSATGYSEGDWAAYYGDRIHYIGGAVEPVITTDLSSTQVEYSQNAAAAALDATATVSDGGTLSYAWYKNSNSSTSGATALGITTATFTPPTTTIGTTYYYCVVTNTKTDVDGTTTAQATSAIANIKVNAPVNAAQLAMALGSDAVASGNTVTLTGNILNIGNTIKVEPAVDITLNLNGHTISGEDDTYMPESDTDVTPLLINGGTGSLTITGNGTIHGADVVTFDGGAALLINGGRVTIENCSIIGGYTRHGSGMHDCGDGIKIMSGSLAINGGTVKGGMEPGEGNGNTPGHGINLVGGSLTVNSGIILGGEYRIFSSRSINYSGSDLTVSDILDSGSSLKAYNDQELTTELAGVPTETLLSSLSAYYIKVFSPVVNAVEPVITTDLSTTQVEYNQNAAATALDATATVSDGGTISYAWYKNTANSTEGATALSITTATYTPLTSTVGTTYYYCVVTNTKTDIEGTTTASTTSAIANIKVNAGGSSGGGSGSGSGNSSNSSSLATAPPAITVTEVNSKLFSNPEDIKVEADVSNAFGQSIAVKITDDTQAQKEIFSLTGAEDKVFPFDISLYSKDSGTKIQPKSGYSVKITMPVPEELLGDREKIKVVYGKDSKLETLKSELIQKDGKWFISFEAVHFSPYALLVSKEQLDKDWANPFSDVKEGAWYHEAVKYAAQNGLMGGTGNSTFSPDMATSRGMIATILYRMSGSTETSLSTFKDVKPDAYYAQAIAWTQKQGIIAGYGNSMFGPEDSITREQLAAILCNYAGSFAAADSTVLIKYKDAADISPYAKEALAWANQNGLINGIGGDLLNPKGQATRAEVAAVLSRLSKGRFEVLTK